METLHTIWVHFGVQTWAEAIFKAHGKRKNLGSHPTLSPSEGLSRCLPLDGQLFVTWLCHLCVYQLCWWDLFVRELIWGIVQPGSLLIEDPRSLYILGSQS